MTLKAKEITVLKVLAVAPDRFATRRSLVEALGYNYLSYDEQRLEAMISRLRKKIAPLGENPIKAAHGRGYVFTQTLKMA
jgi:DNA-binding response OmpR family regulator